MEDAEKKYEELKNELILAKAKIGLLQDTQNIFDLLVNNMDDFIWITNKELEFSYISPSIKKVLGFSEKEFLQKPITDFNTPESKELILKGYSDRKKGISVNKKKHWVIQVYHKNGSIVWIETSTNPIINADGNFEGLLGVSRDITQQITAKSALQKSEYNFRILSDASIDMLSLNSCSQILKYAADIISKKLNNSTVIAFSIGDDKKHTKIAHVAGIGHNTLKSISELTEFNIFDKKYPINKALNKKAITGRLYEYNDGFSEFTSVQLPKTVSKKIKQLLNIDKIYSIGVIKDKEQFGAFYIFPNNCKIEEDIAFIESFANLTSIILQRQQLIEAIHISEDKFRTIFENTSSAISIQTDKKHLLVNKAWEKITGYTAEEAKTLNPIDLIHPNDRDRIIDIVQKRLYGENVPTSYLFHLVDKHLYEKWIDISATVIEYEGKKATLIIGSDITERKKSDIELNKFSTGIMNSPSSIVITDIEGTIEYVNPFFTETTGYSYDEAIGQNPKILSSGNNPKKLYDELWSTILKGEVWNGEFQNIKKNKQLYWESARIAPIFDTNGIITNFIAIKEDITERKRTMELIEQSEMDLREINAKKDKFFSIIAHDLRSPFSGLAGLTSLLKSSLKELSEEQIDNYLGLINQSAQHIFKLLENLLSWAKTQTGKIEFTPSYVTLRQIVDETVSVVAISAKNKDIEIEVNIDYYETVFADENMLKTIIRNLIANAIKYTHKKGTIKISSIIQIFNKKKYNVIAVSDNGMGIPKDKQDKIFNIENNYTTVGTEKEKGTGLGLILCKEFVEKHFGKIWCESKENHGSTFFFSLPVK